ncbi:MAG: family 43 glycosylhydrolase [Methylacidiphilales bacterium]|nr:family 43 glycosylhydrolase [Candidatus Methylacidiphilales bacterium]
MIQPGQIWNDTSGKPIQSHSGGVFFDQGIYYWYGYNWDGPTIPPNTVPQQAFTWFFNRGITIYKSTDLIHWEYASTVLADVSFDPGNLLQPLNGLVRPKIIKNDRTGQYVLMASLIAPDFNFFNDVVVAVSDSPTGPYRLLGKLGWHGKPNETGLWDQTWEAAKNDPPDRIRGFDMGLFKDDDGKAYLIVSRVDAYLYELSDDYLSVIRVQRMEGVEGEAPAPFKAAGTYFIVTSRLTGWAHNRNTYCTASSIRGPWTPRGPFAQGPREETTFDSQVTFVLPVAGKTNAFIFMGDNFHNISDWEIPDLRAATHVWLPIDLDLKNKSMTVPWRERWDLSVFDRGLGPKLSPRQIEVGTKRRPKT